MATRHILMFHAAHDGDGSRVSVVAPANWRGVAASIPTYHRS